MAGCLARPDDLRALPGVGEYTAAAIASLAFGQPVAAVDTNVRRIWARVVHGMDADQVPAATTRLDAQAWLDAEHPGAWNQAVMDLGRDVCRPRPRCEDCPLQPWCRFAAAGSDGTRKRRATTPRQAPFEGSMRQVRGSVLALLRQRPSATIAAVVSATGQTPARSPKPSSDWPRRRDRCVARRARGSTRGTIRLAEGTSD